MIEVSAADPKKDTFILTAQCRAGTGVVAAVTTCLADQGCYICALEQFDDETAEKFFMRAVFRPGPASPPIERIREAFAPVAEGLGMEWTIRPGRQPTRVIIMVSKFDHCLADLLYRQGKGDLNMEIVAVVSNHPDLRSLAEREGIRFVHLPVDPANKQQQEAQLRELIQQTETELVILARYMQILSDELADQLRGRCINIHHSFLPGFKGARPYHQAHERGVKLIGATAHYVTSDLDEGPIIEQVVSRVDHNHKPEDLVKVGRDNECIALTRAVKYHTEHRVFLDGHKTIVFLGS